MRKANIHEIPEEKSGSPKGKFATMDRDLNAALGSDFRSMDMMKRWPFAVELTRVPAGKTNWPFHSHASQFEFYLIVSGTAVVRDKEGETTAVAGDFFMFGPGEPHQIINRCTEDVTYYCVADNPFSDHTYYPDSGKHSIRVPQRGIIKGESAEYYDGEE